MTGGNIDKHTILLGEYTLGLLSAGELARAHALLGSDQYAVADALGWENGLLELTDLLAPVDPSPLLLQRIQNSLGHDTTPPPSSLYRQPANDTRPVAVSAAPAGGGPREKPAADKSLAVPEPPRPPSTANGAPRANRADGTNGANSANGAARGRMETAAIAAPGAAAASTPAAAAGPASVAASASATPAAPAATGHGAASAGPAPAARPPGPQAGAGRGEKRGNIWLWRLASVVFAAIALALALMPAQPVAPPVTILQVAPTQAAILQAPGQSSTPGWVVTVDPQRNVLMQPRVHSDIPADASVQLWTHNKSMPAPRSLGLIDPNQPVTVPAALMGEIGPDQIFEMTLEPAGGSPVASPSGPVLFIGRIVTFGAPGPAGPGPQNEAAPQPGAGPQTEAS